MTGAWHGGKGPNRRREDSAKVEANWPENWSARETERQQDQAFVEQQRAENLRRADDLVITKGMAAIDDVRADYLRRANAAAAESFNAALLGVEHG